MGYRGVLKIWWMLITLLPLKTFAGPHNASQDGNSNNTLDYGINYYEYPVDLFLNDTNNDTSRVGLGLYYIGYFPDYFAYPEFYDDYDQVNETSTNNINPTTESVVRYGRGIKKPKTSLRKTRSASGASVIKHLCMRNLLNVTNNFQKVRYIYGCKDKEEKHFACLNAGGFIKPCFVLKEEQHQLVPLCLKKEIDSNVVTTCNSTDSQYFCFTFPQERNRLVICNEYSLRVCFNGNLKFCENPEKKQPSSPIAIRSKHKSHEKKQLQSPVAIHPEHKHHEKKQLPSLVAIRPNHKKHEKKRVPRETSKSRKHNKRKPDVNCNNCEVDVKVEFDEMANNAPKVFIKVSKLDPLEKMLDILDSDFET